MKAIILVRKGDSKDAFEIRETANPNPSSEADVHDFLESRKSTGKIALLW
ncbi:MAG: hypothetical protein NTV01_02315 [Bacteroidia bacterium]|nr:hypothetical protein [Bacteroidia bacterium]